jgi:antitoxin component YwqK of YwqJK toxin-antitoxin module
MKKAFFLLPIFILLHSANFVSLQAQSQDDIYEKYYANGNIEFSGFFTPNQGRFGEWKFYYENGNLKQIGNYKFDNISGEWKYYRENGDLRSVGNYNDYGSLNGESRFYHENGKLDAIGNYTTGKKTGKWRTYFNNGKLSSIGNYEYGEITGEWKYYRENGDLRSVGNYTNGKLNGESRFYHENGKLSDIGNYRADERIGLWKYYDKNGTLVEENRFSLSQKKTTTMYSRALPFQISSEIYFGMSLTNFRDKLGTKVRLTDESSFRTIYIQDTNFPDVSNIIYYFGNQDNKPLYEIITVYKNNQDAIKVAKNLFGQPNFNQTEWRIKNDDLSEIRSWVYKNKLVVVAKIKNTEWYDEWNE